MFIVIKTVEGKECAVGFIYEEDNFTTFIEEQNADNGAKYVENINIDTLKQDDYPDGHYLIDGNDSNEIVLINKYRILSKGFFYTSTYIYVEPVTKWKYIPYDDINDTRDNINTNTNEVYNSNEKTFLQYDLLEGNNIEDDVLIGIVGRKESGKNLLVESLLKSKSKEYIDESLLITSPSEESFYKARLQGIRIITSFDSKTIREYLNKSTGCIIFDDVVIPKRIRGTIWETVYFDSNKTRIITTQKDITFHPKLKRKMDYMFYLHDDNERTAHKLYNNYGQKIFTSSDEFAEIFSNMTDNFGAIVFKKDTSNGFKVFRYNAVRKVKLD